MRRLLNLLRSTSTTSMTRVALALAAGLVLGSPLAARAEPAPLIPRAVLFGNPEYLDPQISPDGTLLAYLRPDSNNVLQVWVRTLGQADERAVTRDPERGIYAYGWTYTGRDLFYLQDTGGDENFHVLLTNLESGETRDLTPVFGVQANVIAIEPHHPEAMIVTMNRRDPALTEPWRIDLASGALTLLAENPGDVRGWLIDHDLAVRGLIRAAADGGGELCVRAEEGAPWQPLLSWGVADEFQPLEFSADGRTLYAATSIGADTRGLQAFDLATGRLTPLASEPGSDLEHTLFHPTTHAPQAAAFNRLRSEWRALDPSVAPDLEALAALEAGALMGVSRDLADRRWIAGMISDTGGLRYYAWERETGRAEPLFSAMPALEAYALAPMRGFELESRDGLSLPCYLTLPVGVPAEKLPMVVRVHGGPWWRDFWGFDPEVQWLANRGYAVLQVNFRGSSGFGKAFLQAARKEFAGRMHDDLIDGVRWAIAEGIADPQRIGIMGASYGGYATLVGLAFTPEVFACGVDVVGPSNLVTLIESFPPYWKPFLSVRWYPLVGDPSDAEDREDMLARSPITRVDRIRAPLLVGQGANDPRVKQAESDAIVSALRARGVAVEYIVFPDEGHGFQRPENRLAFNAAAEAFLARHLGGAAE